MTPEVSVIVPLYNAALTVEQALRSLREGQADTTWEAIVVDDGSTDDGPSRVAAVAAVEPRIRLLSQRNTGLAGARNAGIAAARGAHLHFLDADDWLLPGALRALLGAVSTGRAGAAYGGSAWHDADGVPLGWSFEPSCPSVGTQELHECGRFQPVCQMVTRAALGDERFRDAYPGAEDHDLWLRLAERGVRWRSCETDVAAYRLCPGSLSRNFALMGASLIGAVRDSFRRCAALTQPPDLDAARESAITDRIALDHATALAVDAAGGAGGTVGAANAGAILRRLGRTQMITPQQAALSAYWMAPYAECLAPNVWRAPALREQRFSLVRRLSVWWEHLSQAKLAQPGLQPRALDALAELIPQASTVATAIARSFRLGDRVAVYGLGREGRAVAHALIARGVEVVGVDDALDTGQSVTVGNRRVPVLPIEEAAQASAACILAANHHERMIVKVPANIRIILWREAQRVHAVAARAELHSAWRMGESA